MNNLSHIFLVEEKMFRNLSVLNYEYKITKNEVLKVQDVITENCDNYVFVLFFSAC